MRTIKHFCGSCLNTYGDRTELEENMLGCIEQEVCNISYTHSNQKINFYVSHKNLDPPICNAAAFECMKVPLESADDIDSMEKLFVNKPVALVHNVVKKS